MFDDDTVIQKAALTFSGWYSDRKRLLIHLLLTLIHLASYSRILENRPKRTQKDISDLLLSVYFLEIQRVEKDKKLLETNNFNLCFFIEEKEKKMKRKKEIHHGK